MVAATPLPEFDSPRPVDLNSLAFHDHKYLWYEWMREEAPVCAGKVSIMKVTLVSRYDDCKMVLSDPRFVRNRSTARGKGSNPLPFPMPKSIAALAKSMILEDDPEHRRLRSLVNQGFSPRAVAALSDRVTGLTEETLDGLSGKEGPIDLLNDYARRIPMQVIADMVGVSSSEAKEFGNIMGTLTQGLTGMRMIRTLFWDLRSAQRFVRDLIHRKRGEPGDDILSELIGAEHEGQRLNEDELVAMVFLLMIGGFETTLHLITNGTRALIEHPDQLERLRANPDLWGSGVEEIVRYRGPIHGTKLQYAAEDISLHGETISRGSPVIPMLGAANHDPRAFEKPDEFDITRSPNHHLGFGFGPHFCLGRQLALMEARVSLEKIFSRYPDLRLAVPANELKIAAMPGWHRHASLPVILG
ncbi:MAG: cytochrome P450 [Myxococcota bacterium]|nr:cytochrome P450 [Myxococcota bacterium]